MMRKFRAGIFAEWCKEKNIVSTQSQCSNNTTIVENRDNMRSNKALAAALWVSILGLIVAFVHIALHLFKVVDYSIIDANTFSSAVIGVLGILITVLIGWNIYSVFDWKERLEKIEGIEQRLEQYKAELEKDNKRTKASLFLATSKLYFAQLNPASKERPNEPLMNPLAEYLRHSLMCIYNFVEVGDYDGCESVIGVVNDVLSGNNSLSISDFDFNQLQNILNKIKWSSPNVSNYNKMTKLIYQLTPEHNHK